jgi:hypothetical protein
VLYYQAASGGQDVAATVLVSGPGDSSVERLAVREGEAQASVDETLKLLRAGREEELMTVD